MQERMPSEQEKNEEEFHIKFSRVFDEARVIIGSLEIEEIEREKRFEEKLDELFAMAKKAITSAEAGNAESFKDFFTALDTVAAAFSEWGNVRWQKLMIEIYAAGLRKFIGEKGKDAGVAEMKAQYLGHFPGFSEWAPEEQQMEKDVWAGFFEGLENNLEKLEEKIPAE